MTTTTSDAKTTPASSEFILDAKVPSGPIEEKWTKAKFDYKLAWMERLRARMQAIRAEEVPALTRLIQQIQPNKPNLNGRMNRPDEGLAPSGLLGILTPCTGAGK